VVSYTGVTYEARKIFNESQLLQVILGQMMITIISKSLIAAKKLSYLKRNGLKVEYFTLRRQSRDQRKPPPHRTYNKSVVRNSALNFSDTRTVWKVRSVRILCRCTQCAFCCFYCCFTRNKWQMDG